MSIILFDSNNRRSLLPLTFACAVADLRTGIFTARERWELLTGSEVFVYTQPYLQPLYKPLPKGRHVWVDAAVLANATLAEAILGLDGDTALADANGFIAGIADDGFNGLPMLDAYRTVRHIAAVRRLQYPWQIFQWNDAVLREDFVLATRGKISQPVPAGNQCLNEEDIFIEEGAEVNFSIINAATGPVYIGKNAVIMEGCLIRGPFAVCEEATIKMGAKIYGATTIGPHCAAGGEIKNSVMQAYSNKGHDGYLGDSVIGRWCNLGAGTSNSNVKNTGGQVAMYSYDANTYISVGMKAGLIMGDYSRAAINTSFNTGTVTGVCCNIFGSCLQPKYIPGFSWGSREKYQFEKALQDIANWKKMKHEALSDEEIKVLREIYEQS